MVLEKRRRSTSANPRAHASGEEEPDTGAVICALLQVRPLSEKNHRMVKADERSSCLLIGCVSNNVRACGCRVRCAAGAGAAGAAGAAKAGIDGLVLLSMESDHWEHLLATIPHPSCKAPLEAVKAASMALSSRQVPSRVLLSSDVARPERDDAEGTGLEGAGVHEVPIADTKVPENPRPEDDEPGSFTQRTATAGWEGQEDVVPTE